MLLVGIMISLPDFKMSRFLLLIATFAVTAQADEDQCPGSHPFAYYNGEYCCASYYEKAYVGQGAKCDGSEIQLDSLCCRNDEYTNCQFGICSNAVLTVRLGAKKDGRWVETKMAGENVNSGTPIPAEIAFKVPNEDAWIIGAKDDGFLKMVKIQVLGASTYKWISTKYRKYKENDPSCNYKNFDISCFIGAVDTSLYAYQVLLVAEKGQPLSTYRCTNQYKCCYEAYEFHKIICHQCERDAIAPMGQDCQWVESLNNYELYN